MNLLRTLTLLLMCAWIVPAQFLGDVRRPDGRIPNHPHRVRRFAPITLKLHQVDAEIVDGVAKTTLRQVFKNPNGINLEATYLFPLPDDAAISNFELMMNGEMVGGEVLEKEKAESIYTGIVRRQQDPALLEYMGRRLFKARIFPVPASGETEIRLTYTQVLPRDGRTIEYRYPFRTRSVTGAPVDRAAVRVKLKSATPVMTVYSPSHEVDVTKKGDHQALVSYESKSDPGDRDFVMMYGLTEGGAVGATLFSRVEPKDGGAFLLLLAPSSDLDEAPVNKDVVFVLDTSGSMAGEKMEQARKALSYCINRLGEGDRFNIVSFSTEARSWQESLVAADKDRRKAALEHVKALPPRGGTNINDALVSALSLSKESDRPLMVIFITDGEPTIGETLPKNILKNVKAANKALTRLFVFGVGEDLKVELLDSLAEQNHGTRDYVGARESIEAKVSSFYDKVASPVLSGVKLSFEGVSVREMHPRVMPDLFHGGQLLVTGRYSGSGTAVIRLKGKVNGKEVEHVFERKFEDQGDRAEFVPRLWAVRRVGFLLDQVRLNGEKKELREEVVRLGKKYGIVTPYTSYLVVEDSVAGVRDGRGRSIGRPDGPTGGGSGRLIPGGGRGGGRFGVPTPRPATPGSPVGTTAGQPDPQAELAIEEVRRAEALKKGLVSDDRLGFLSGAKRDALDADDRAAKARFRRGYFGDAITLSKELMQLRESRTGKDAGEGLVRRVGGRVFIPRGPLWIELKLLEKDPKELLKGLKKVTAFSDEYWALLKSNPKLAEVFALGQDLLLLNGDQVIQIVAAEEAKDPAGK